MKKIFNMFVLIIGFLSFSYYCSKFYTHRGLAYDEKYMPLYVVVTTIMLINFAICAFNSYKIEKQAEEIKEIKEQNSIIMNQNEEFKNLIIALFDKMDENQDNLLTAMYNSREISLDVYNKLRECD